MKPLIERAITAFVGCASLMAAATPGWADCEPQQTNKLTTFAGTNPFNFGVSVSFAGNTAVIGADQGGVGNGRAYVFVRSGGTWVQQAQLTASDAAPADFFGGAVSVYGNTALVGADRDDHSGGSDAGSAYVFVRSGAVWTQQAKLTASDAASNDLFGHSVSIYGDTAVVGSVLDTNAGGTNAGSAYVFVRSGTVWTQQAKLTASDAGGGDNFGQSVSISGDTALIGAH